MDLKLVEIFHSIQGEGKFSGQNAIFVRFAGCNLNCVNFGVKIKSPKTGEILVGCDTLRAVKISHFSYRSVKNADEILAIIYKFAKNFRPIVVITGGEPLLNYANPIFYEFVCKLLDENFSVHFETNGTISPDFDKFARYKNCIFAISPKLKNSGVAREKRLNFEALKQIKKNAKDSFYKFVIDENLQNEIGEILKIAPNEVYCMPLGANKKELEKNAEFVFKFCLKNGYNYSDRLHIRIFDDKEEI